MDAIKELQLEIGGISKEVNQFAMTSSIENAFCQMEKALGERDFEAMLYCYEKIIDWYDNVALAEIEQEKRSDTYDEGYDFYLHCAIRQLKVLFDKIKAESLQTDDSITQDESSIRKLVFISHKSDDKKYGDALRNYLIGLGLRDDQLIYTSHPLNKIPLGENIYEYLRKNIHAGIFMIILWSDKYLESPACLNEMGAAWVVQVDYTNVYVPTFTFGNPKYHECAVDTQKMGAVLNGDQHCKANMIELKNKIQQMFGLQDDEKRSSYLLDQFVNEILEEKE